MEPKIGIVICGLQNSRQFVSNAYIQSVRYSKGLPVVLPLVRSDHLLEEYIALCDGFLFCGGEDITPLLFGQEPKDGIGRTDITLDLFQIRLMKKILKTTKPVFSICRGMQIFNVACGGTICQDTMLQSGNILNHMQHSDTKSDVSHRITTRRGSHLKRCIGSCLYVNSFHHQAIETIGQGLTACAHASDKTVEALELSEHPFALGVQWHPECMYRTSSEMRELFSEFIFHCAS